MIVLDSSVVYALLDRRDRRHLDATHWYGTVSEEVATTPLVLAEIDYLVRRRAGTRALRAFRRDVAAGAHGVEWWAGAASESVRVAETYPALGLSLTDASLVVLAARLETSAIATFDQRHFRAVRPLAGAPAFTILPADA